MTKQKPFEEVHKEIREMLKKAQRYSMGVSDAIEIIEAYKKHVPYLLDIIEGKSGIQRKLF